MSAAPRRRRVLVGAYACGPGQGSEPGSGWQLARAAAESNDVWLVTRRRFAASIDAALEADANLRAHLNVHYLELSDLLVRLKRGAVGVYWYYLLWQWRLGRVAERLHAEVGFDVAHHATFASDWLPTGLRRLPADVPLVWGPVGGATYTPRALRPWLGWSARITETAREVLTRTARRVWGDATARRAAVVVVHNDDVASRFSRRTVPAPVVEPNPALSDAEIDGVPEAPRDPDRPRAVFVGRLVSWKGTRIALEAVAARPEWQLDFIGAGSEHDHLVRRAERLAVSERIQMRGSLSRAAVLSEIRRADVLLLPSMHDSASWVTAEAVSLGTPVVCLDVGGPPIVMDGHGIAVAPCEPLVPAVADSLEVARSLPRRRSARWREERLPSLVDHWYDLAQESAGARAPTASAYTDSSTSSDRSDR